MLPADIARRKPVWIALSEFYLDTELQPTDFIRIRAIMVQSGYTNAEIRQINYDEVAPILLNNLLSMVGIWDGFDETWLIETILKRLDSLANRRSHSWFFWLWKKQVDYFTDDYFRQLFG